jgi:streptogramin lyase
MKSRFLVIFFIAVAFVSEAQTVTDPWATLGASNIQTAFIAMDASNNLYVTNKINSTISKITPNGTVTQAWATLATGSNPYGMTIDAAGNLYTVNRGTPGPYTVSKITPSLDGSSGTVIQTWASLGAEAYSIAIDASGNLYVPYISNNKIAKIVPANGGATGNITNPWVTLATGANPFSISFDASGNLYSANSNNTISKITPTGTVTQAWATLAASSNPQFMVFDPSGNMYVSCWGTSKVAKINSSGTVTDNWSLGTDVWPAGIVLDAAGNIFTSNYHNHTISKVTSSGAVTQAYVTLANGSYPFYLAKDASGNLYTTNMGNGTVSRILGPTLYTNSFGQRVSIDNVNTAISPEGGANFGTGKDVYGKRYNTTGIATYSGTVGSTTAVLGGVISPTNTISSSIGVRYSTDINFGTYSTTTIQSNVAGGTYTSSISGLATSTNYYAKAFVTNSSGTNLGEIVSFTTTTPSLVSDGLVLSLDAGNSSSYSGTGSTWTDLSGKGNNGTLYNSVSYNSSNSGSLVFNGYENGQGPNPYVLLPTNTDFDFGSDDFALEMWIYISPTNDHPNFLSINVDPATNFAAIRMSYYQGNLGVSHSINNSTWSAQQGTSFSLNTWKNIVVSRISGQVTVYIDGISKLSYSLPGSLMSNNLNVIGTIYPNFGNPAFYNLSGNIAVTRFYKGRGLISTEASTHFSLLKSRFGL